MLSFFIFIGILIVLILVHEFGHFIVAKAFGIRVDEFGIFFPPRLFGWKVGETLYSLNAIPIGGFVKIFGETASEAEEPAGSISEENSLARRLSEDSRGRSEDFFGGNTSGRPDSRSFVSKHRLVQAAVIVAGIVFNIMFAWLVVSAGYMFGMQSSVDHIGVGEVHDAHTFVTGVVPDSPAARAGIKSSDTIESVETGTAQLLTNYNAEQVRLFIAAHQDESIVVHVKRAKAGSSEGEMLNFVAKPVEGLVEGHKALGIELDDVGILKLNPALALVEGAIVTKEMMIETAVGLGTFFHSLVRGTLDFNQTKGPIGIVAYGAQTVTEGYMNTLFLTALISINLALINIIPIPGLDGGRLLFIIIEGVTRKPLSQKIASKVTFVGLGLLILLMLVISYHDVLHLVHPV